MQNEHSGPKTDHVCGLGLALPTSMSWTVRTAVQPVHTRLNPCSTVVDSRRSDEHGTH